jgi:hypothetical protein
VFLQNVLAVGPQPQALFVSSLCIRCSAAKSYAGHIDLNSFHFALLSLWDRNFCQPPAEYPCVNMPALFNGLRTVTKSRFKIT